MTSPIQMDGSQDLFSQIVSGLTQANGQNNPLLAQQVQRTGIPGMDMLAPTGSANNDLREYHFSGEIAQQGGIIGEGADYLTGALGPAAGFGAMHRQGRRTFTFTTQSGDTIAPDGSRTFALGETAERPFTDADLDQVSIQMSDDFRSFDYTAPNGNTRSTKGKEVSLLAIREGWKDPATRERLIRHFRSEENPNIRVVEEQTPDGEDASYLEFDAELNVTLREDATVDPDGSNKGNQGEQQHPQDERTEQGLVVEGESANGEAVADLNSVFGAMLGAGGAGQYMGNFNSRNHFGIGGNMSWSDLGGAVSLGGAAKAFSGLSALMPSTSIAPGVHMPTMGTGALTIALEGGARVLGAPGMAFRAREIRESMIQIQKDEYMISTIRNSSIPIEYLIMIVMGHVYDSAEKRMRLKLEEIIVAEQLARRREMREGIGNVFKGALNFVTGGIGGAVVDGAQSFFNHLDSSLNGNMKSQTVLIQELQHMTQILKQLMELISNMSKNFHDMAMVPVRNLR
ncbi:MAG: hypothetical protein AAF658_04975 [Myxococcota bacterium]